MIDNGDRTTKQRQQRLRGDRSIAEFYFEDEQLQQVLTQFRNALIEQEGLGQAAVRGHDVAVNVMQRTVRVEDLVNAGICSVVDGKLVRYDAKLTDPETS